MSIICANCQTQLPDDAIFCSECGTQVAETEEQKEEKSKPSFCLQCGKRLPENAKFCLACGTRVTTDTKRWFEKIERESVEEIFKNPYPPTHPLESEIFDFENEKDVISLRAERYAAYLASLMHAPDWFNSLYHLAAYSSVSHWRCPPQEWFNFWMNKPNAQQAFVSQSIIAWFTSEARKRGYIYADGKFAPIVLAYIDPDGYQTEELQALRIPSSYPELEELAKKDDEMFPPPQPVQEKVAGAVLNFTTDEAAIVVYTDCSHKGKRIVIGNCQNPYISHAVLSEPENYEVEIVERFIDNTSVCAAIFPYIPFVDDRLKHFQQVVHQVDFTVRTYLGFDDKWEETITVVRGKVTELDWRGKHSQVK